jgi:hypothetical protein
MYIKIYLNETVSEIQIGRYFSDTFPKGLEKESSLYHNCFQLCFFGISLRNPSKPGENDKTCQRLLQTVFIYCVKT